MDHTMNLLLLDPFHTGSHAYWSSELTTRLNQRHSIKAELCTLHGRHWKWRMHGSAAAFASLLKQSYAIPDVILTTDMMDVAAFRGLLSREWRGVPIIQYFHENQLTFPWNKADPDFRNGQNRTYGFINIQSALAADTVLFNSKHHRLQFLNAVSQFLSKQPDYKLSTARTIIEKKSAVIPIGIRTDSKISSTQASPKTKDQAPVLLWNHRWENDKAPDNFLRSLLELRQQNLDFNLVLLGQQFDRMPNEWIDIHRLFQDQIIHTGYTENSSDYFAWLRSCDFLIHDPRQEYFGISVLEAMQSGVIPLVSKGHAYDEWMPEIFFRNTAYTLSEQLIDLQINLKSNANLAKQIASVFDWEHVLPRYEEKISSFTS
jgi:glycosyltransferase involved in cell wall biosynthesis